LKVGDGYGGSKGPKLSSASGSAMMVSDFKGFQNKK